MDRSRLIAGFIGPVLAAIGAGTLLNAEAMSGMARQLAGNTGLIFLSGILLLLAGLAIVRNHNIWSGGWPVLVTVLGWLAIVGGLARMWFPQIAEPMVTAMSGRPVLFLAAGLVNLALGAFLSFKAYR